MKKFLFILALLSILAIFPVSSAFAETPYPAWSGSIPADVPEPLIVKVGSTVLPNGYTFQPVHLQMGEVHTKTITVTNNGASSLFVTPTINFTNANITAVWTVGASGRTISAGTSFDFVLTITAISATAEVSIPIGFTRQ